jgi:nucleoside-diphosphate-sugar epimerase
MTDTASRVVAADLEYISAQLDAEFRQMGGTSLLVVGGAGFLGYYLVQSVLHWNRTGGASNPIDVTVFDNYVRGIPQWLADLDGDAHLHLVEHDITEPLPVRMPDVQYIIHAASIASPLFYRQHPIETMDSNVNGLRSLLEYARRQQSATRPVEGFLFFSSSEIYGDPTPENIPTPETYRGNVSCTGPRACYDESKRYGETLCVNFAQQYGLPIKVARPFNNYGPGLKITDHRVLPDFARDVFSNRSIVMKSDGGPRRTFCYVADAITGYYKVLTRGRAGEAYNIGIEAPEISVAELAERVVRLSRELFGYDGDVVTRYDAEYVADNPTRRCPVIEKARTEIGYSPSILVDEGLRRALIWYSGNQVAEEA